MSEVPNYLTAQESYLQAKLKKTQRRLVEVQKVIKKTINESNPQIIPIHD